MLELEIEEIFDLFDFLDFDDVDCLSSCCDASLWFLEAMMRLNVEADTCVGVLRQQWGCAC